MISLCGLGNSVGDLSFGCWLRRGGVNSLGEIYEIVVPLYIFGI
jgi:hypothetical protein